MSDGYVTVKLPREVDDDDYDDDLLDGEALNERRKELRQTWLEFVNGQAPALDIDADEIAASVQSAVGGRESDIDPDRLVQAVEDAIATEIDLEPGDIRQASYQGAKEALRDVGPRH